MFTLSFYNFVNGAELGLKLEPPRSLTGFIGFSIVDLESMRLKAGVSLETVALRPVLV